MRILLHCCCAPCAGGCVERLLSGEDDSGNRRTDAAMNGQVRNRGDEVVLFFANSNLADHEEFEKRLDSVKKLSSIYDLELAVQPYEHEIFLREAAAGFENEPEGGARCRRCFASSLRFASAAAEKLGCEKFCTSLTVSPHKNSEIIRQEGERFNNFEFHNFKKQNGFLRSMKIAREHGFYLQDFCGCEFSRRNKK